MPVVILLRQYVLLRMLTYDELQIAKGQIQLTDSDLISDLLKYNILSPLDCAEENKILCANKIFRFSNSTARVTIIPALECNFRCWYCYETHESGRMSAPDVDTVISFCKNLIAQGGLKSFVLDWFGGEPLLYFDNIVFPISLAIKAYCKENGVEFYNSITTNGFFVTEDLIHRFNEIELKNCFERLKHVEITLYDESFFDFSSEKMRKYHL